jgi:hypothetical protein
MGRPLWEAVFQDLQAALLRSASQAQEAAEAALMPRQQAQAAQAAFPVAVEAAAERPSPEALPGMAARVAVAL